MQTTYKPNQKCLIILSGGGDTFVTMAPAAALDWINSPVPSSGGRDEVIPAEVRQGYEDDYVEIGTTVYVTCGSGDNDRALVVQGDEFDSVTEAIQAAANNGYEVIGDFIGNIY